MIFQWESPSATAYLKQLFSDETISKIRAIDPNFSYMNLLSIGNGAIRPAGESYRDKLAKGEYKSYNNKELDEFMKPTLGYMVYQEQIIEFLHKFCGFTMGEADVVRRCVDENSLITTGYGYQVAIKDLKPGDKVISYNENGYSEVDTVNKVFDNGIQECFSVKTTNCNELICTKTHKILTQDGFKQVSELTESDWVMVPSRIVYDNDGLRSNQRLGCDTMFMIGLLIGDGSLHLSPSYVNHEVELIEKYKQCVEQLSRSKEKCEFAIFEADGVTVDKVYTVKVTSVVYRNALINLLNKLGLRKTSIEKRISNDIMSYPADEKLSNLLAGLFNSDGGYNIRTNSIEYSSISCELVCQIKCLLLKYGIYSYITKAIVKGYGYYAYVLHISHLESLKVFEKEILKYMIGKKRKAFGVVIDSAKNIKTFDYMLPPKCKDEICAASLTSGKSIRMLSLDSGYDLEIKKKYPSITDTKARYFASRLYCPETYKMLTADYIPLKVKSITPVGERHVYDIEVSKNHNYIADGIIVHNCFAKKTGTEKVIPTIKDGGYLNENHYIKGFIQTMKDEYGVEKDEAEQLIVDFLQVIIDASDYLFSKNHADPYSWIGYICGYLRYYYPLEFITVGLNIFASKEKKSLAIINYAKKLGIRISPIKFRKSIAEYTFDKETNQIYKGIASIKYMNEEVANELYALRNGKYPTFVDLINAIFDHTCVNSRQMKILIDLDFFSEFGDANMLMAQYDLFVKFSERSQIRKAELAGLGVSEDLVRSCAGRETVKMFSEINMVEFLRVICSNVKYKRRTLGEKIKAQVEHLGYIDEVSDKYKGMAVVTELETKYSPKMMLYSLRNGSVESVKVGKREFNKCKLKDGDIIRVTGSILKPKVRRLEDGTFQEVPDMKERWITSYKLMEA